MSSRLEILSGMLEKQPDDTFLLYAIAMEYKKVGQLDETLAMLEKTIAAEPTHAYAWYQKGQTLEAKGDASAAMNAYQNGIAAANKIGDAKARGELETALAELQ